MNEAASGEFFESRRDEKRDFEKGVQTYYSSPGPTPSAPKIQSAQTPGARATAILFDRNHFHNTKNKVKRPPASSEYHRKRNGASGKSHRVSTNPKRGCPRQDRSRKTTSSETKKQNRGLAPTESTTFESKDLENNDVKRRGAKILFRAHACDGVTGTYIYIYIYIYVNVTKRRHSGAKERVTHNINGVGKTTLRNMQ